MSVKSDSFRVPRIKPMIMVTTTTIAPASVGFKEPEMIPGTMKAYQPDFKASIKFCHHSITLIFPPDS